MGIMELMLYRWKKQYKGWKPTRFASSSNGRKRTPAWSDWSES